MCRESPRGSRWAAVLSVGSRFARGGGRSGVNHHLLHGLAEGADLSREMPGAPGGLGGLLQGLIALLQQRVALGAGDSAAHVELKQFEVLHEAGRLGLVEEDVQEQMPERKSQEQKSAYH